MILDTLDTLSIVIDFALLIWFAIHIVGHWGLDSINI